MLRGILFIIVFLSLNMDIRGQELDLKFSSVGKEKGLSNSNSTCITQDSLGYIWIGTQEGLNKYDGIDILVYKTDYQDSTSLPHNFIRCLYTDSAGIVWVGSDNGICYYQPYWDNFRKIRLPAQLPGQEISKVDFIKEIAGHGLLFSMSNKLYKIDKNTNSSSQYLTIKKGEISSFLGDEDENIWIGAFKGGGLQKYSKEKELIRQYDSIGEYENSPGSSSVLSISLRAGNKLWIATEDAGINCLDIAKEEFIRYFSGVYEEKFTRYTYVDQNNRLWIADQIGIKLFNDEQNTFEGYFTDNKNTYSIKPNAYSIYQDLQGIYWVLHLHGGVSRSIQQKGFKIFTDNPSETWHSMNKNISVVKEDMQGNLWLGNPFNGIDIFHWERNTTLRFTHASENRYSLGSGAVFALEQGESGMWVGTYRGGLQYIDEKLEKFVSYLHNPSDTNSISNNDVRGITIDSKGDIWLAVHGSGVDRYDPEEGIFYHYTKEKNNLSNEWTVELIEDHLGNVWVATVYGLCRLPQGKQKFINYYSENSNPNTLSNDEIITVFEDSLYRVWAGTSQGLNLYNRERDIFEPVSGDLGKEYICSILDDNHNNLWVATLNGLYQYDPETGEYNRFDESDGLPTKEFNPRSSYKNTFNDLFFGTIEGVILFDPNNLQYNRTVPSIVISNFRLFNKELDRFGPDFPLDHHVSFAKEIRLEYDQNMITFEFLAISMINPEKNNYAYMLEGFDDDWHQIGNRREATYTNLNPGKYIFKVIASNNDGVWNMKGTSIVVIVNPPWWGTVWFRLLLGFFIVFGLVGFFYLRTYQLRKQKLLLEKKVRKSTLELQGKNRQLLEKSNHLNEVNSLLEERQQELMEKSNKLQELNTSKDRLFSIISHDLTSPFNSILGLSEILQTEYETLDEKERKKMAESINDSSKRVYSLLDNLLNWARTQTNRIKYDPEKLDLTAILEEVIDIYKFRLDTKKINVDIHRKTDKEPFADEDMVKSIFRNLLSNATKYTPTKGNIAIILEEDNSEIRISISDSGIGIQKEIYNNLFDLDKSSSQDGTDGEKGSGIGLILANEFIGLNGGILSIKSAHGKGSTFSFTLPLAQ